MQPVSQRDIAAAAGVSVSAVSLALRNHPKVSLAVRERIHRVARELGYRTDPRVAQLMGHLRTARARRAPSKLAALLPDLSAPQLAQHRPIKAMVEGARELADEAGFELEIFPLGGSGLSLSRVRTILLTRGIQGVFVAPFHEGANRFDFDFADFAAATAGYSVLAPRLHRACPNHELLFSQLFAWLEMNGYRRPGLALTASSASLKSKFAAAAFLLHQQQFPAEERLPMLWQSGLSDFQLLRWLDAHRPDVVLGGARVLEQLRRLSLHDVGAFDFVGFENPGPPVSLYHHLVGRESIRLILSQTMLNQTGVPTHPKTVLVETQWQPWRVSSRTLNHGAASSLSRAI